MTRKPRPHKRATIALCVIARDEERFIAECLDSARSFVDEMIVLDTGSVDRTREIAVEHGARVESFVWCDDFAAARNAAIDAATADWILMLDADERLEPGSGPVLRDLPRRMPANVHGACPRIESRSLEGAGGISIAGQVPRFFRRSPDVRYVGAIHEDLVYLPDPEASRNVVLDDLRVTHYGYDSAVYAEKRKDQRNTQLLERQLARDPDDARALFFLAQQHHAMGRHAEAIDVSRRFLERADDVREGFVVETYAMLLKSLAELDRDTEVEATTRAGEARHLLGAAAYEVLAVFEERRGRRSKALDYLGRALDQNLPSGVTQDAGIGGWATRLHLAELYERLGQAVSALDQLERAYPELPEHARGVVALQSGALAVRAAAAGEAVRWLERARRDAADEIEPQTQLLQLALQVCGLTPLAPLDAVERALAEEDWQAAYDAARVLPARGAAGYVRLLKVATELRSRGAAEASLHLLERALDSVPKDKQVYWQLIRTLTDLGRYEDAELAVEAVRDFASVAA